MKIALSVAAVSLALAGCAGMAPQAATAPKEMKIAFDVTDGNPKALMVKLATIETTRTQLIDAGVTPHLVVAFRGEASWYTQADDSVVKEADRADAAAIKAKMRQLKALSGVDGLEQCNLPLAPRKLKAEGVMPEVKVVPNGWISLVSYQQQGYAYIAP
jgi:intracellular sulfur oxidation DsrE/DsrF family protein